jgi:hypothetical protein
LIQALLLAAAPCAALAAQEPALRRVEARITAVSSASVYLDKGADHGLATGDRARALPPAASPVELVVRSVSRQSARCEPLAPSDALEIDVPVEVLVPESRAAASDAAQAGAHPPWTQPIEGWKQDLPLLAPAESVTPEARESRLSGQWYFGVDATRDGAGDDQEYVLARSGLDLVWDNATGRGDTVELDVEAFHRGVDVELGTDDAETRLRVDQLSWTLGDTRTDPRRLAVGRFVSRDVPEFGVLDGVEYARRLDSGDRWGFGAGFLPEWTAERSTGDDVALQAFYRHLFDPEGDLQLGGAVQKTWHDGAPDRDLALADLDWRASERWTFAATAWLDLYGSSDGPKSSGVELTELIASATGRLGDKTGVRASILELRWPALERDELPPVTAATLAGGEVRRASLDLWRDVARDWRVGARASRWDSDTDAGGSGELRAAWRDPWWEAGEISAALFLADGERIGAQGVRIGARGASALGTWWLSLEAAQRELEDFAGSGSTLDQQAVRAGIDRGLGADWSLSVSIDQRFGDSQDATSAGFFLTRRF